MLGKRKTLTALTSELATKLVTAPEPPPQYIRQKNDLLELVYGDFMHGDYVSMGPRSPVVDAYLAYKGATYKQVSGAPVDLKTRQMAKVANFAVSYGVSAQTLRRLSSAHTNRLVVGSAYVEVHTKEKV